MKRLRLNSASLSIFGCILQILAAGAADAAWIPNGTSIASPIESDGHGGFFGVAGGPFTPSVLHFDSNADAGQWPSRGVELVPGNTFAIHASIDVVQTLPDGDGGLYLLTAERGPYPGSGGFLNEFRMYLHRRDSAGHPASGWTPEGVVVETEWLWPPYAANHLAVMTSDGRGGVLVVFSDGDSYYRHFAVQRVSGNGVALWGEDGLMIRDSVLLGSVPSVVADGLGGAFALWAEWNVGGTRLVARGQHVSATGVPLWGSSGRQVSTSTFAAMDQAFPPSPASLMYVYYGAVIAGAPDGQGGAWLAWSGGETGALDVFATRISSEGRSRWGGELRVCSAPGDQRGLTLTAEPGNDVLIAWRDGRDPTRATLRAQCIGPSGQLRWDPQGIVVGENVSDRALAVAGDDGQGATMFAWPSPANGGEIWRSACPLRVILLTAGRMAANSSVERPARWTISVSGSR